MRKLLHFLVLSWLSLWDAQPFPPSLPKSLSPHLGCPAVSGMLPRCSVLLGKLRNSQSPGDWCGRKCCGQRWARDLTWLGQCHTNSEKKPFRGFYTQSGAFCDKKKKKKNIVLVFLPVWFVLGRSCTPARSPLGLTDSITQNPSFWGCPSSSSAPNASGAFCTSQS